jgi:hypothetical protein
MLTTRDILLTSFTTKIAKILTPEEAKKQEKRLLTREAKRRVSHEMTKEEKKLLKEMRGWQRDYPIQGAAIGGAITGIPGAIAGAMAQMKAQRAIDRTVGKKVNQLWNQNKLLGLAAGTAALPLEMATRFLPHAGAITTAIPGFYAGYRSGQAIADWRTTDKHRASEKRHQELWDKHRYDPELQKRVGMAVERMQRK